MKFKEKIHTIKQFIIYACTAKTKFRIHSPFVFNFTQNILKKNNDVQSNLKRQILKYHTKYNTLFNTNNNAGAGSVVLNKTKSIEVEKFSKNVGLPHKYGVVLQNIVHHYNCEKTLELGTSLGISTSYLVSNKKNHVTTIEANKDFYNATKKAYEAVNIKNITFVNAFFEDVLNDIGKQNGDFSLIFIDGDHTLKATLENFNTIKPYLNEKSIVILDDIYWSKEMTEAWHEIRKDKDVSLSIDLFRIGLLFFRNENYKQEHFTLWY